MQLKEVPFKSLQDLCAADPSAESIKNVFGNIRASLNWWWGCSYAGWPGGVHFGKHLPESETDIGGSHVTSIHTLNVFLALNVN